jgi:predicted RNase H-like HicB family nuclease
MPSYTVHAHWDPASSTWWTDGEEIPGLTCQADSFEELLDLVFELAPELLRDNGIEPPGQSIDITVIAEWHATACIAA